MQHNWSKYLRWIITLLIACTAVGLFFGEPLYGLSAGLLAYLWWTLAQAKRLYHWLGNPSGSDEAPQSVGLWGDIFDGLHRLHQNHLRTQDKLRAQINRVQESTNAMRDGVIMTDSRGAMEWWNGSAEHLLGFRRSSDRGQFIHNLIRNPAFKAYFDSRDYREPLELNSPAKPHIHLQIQISLFGDDDRLIVAKDVTRLYQLEQMRRDFVGNVSHEMRTPLTVISGYLETLVDNADDLPPKWRRAINTMAQQSSRMEALITDLRLNAPHVKVSVVMPGHVGTDIRRNSLKAMGRGDAMDLDADTVAHIRKRLVDRGMPVDNLPDDAIRQMMEQLSRDFKDKAPMNAAQASAIILDGIRDDQWRILVGDDAHALDELVRTDPYHAYEPEFIEPLVQQGHLGGATSNR